MRKDFSYGIIPLRFADDLWEVFVIKHRSGHWGFPKGHAEKGETPRQAAARELFEETGLSVTLYWEGEPLVENFTFHWRSETVHKTVTYFIAKVEGKEQLQQDEVEDGKWVLLDRAEVYLTYPEAKSLCQQVRRMIGQSQM